jgi:histidine triad (HIT) family protein
LEGDFRVTSDCIFCKIANGEIPSKTLFEDEDFRVILDIEPASKGHALILPKEHFHDIYALNEDISKKIFVLAVKMAREMEDTLKCDGFNILQNNGVHGGQTVFHFHMHLIPRYKNDDIGLQSKEKNPLDYDLGDIEKIIKRKV